MEGGRIEFSDFNPNPMERQTFWSLVIGGGIAWSFWYSVSQVSVQRALSSKDLHTAKLAFGLNIPILSVAILLCAAVGLVAFATYGHCDPVRSGRIKTIDQVFPLLVMDSVGHLPGLPGLFVAGMLSSSLSSISSGWNALASVAYRDFIIGTRWKHLSPEAGAKISKISCTVSALLTIAFVVLVSKMGGVLQASFIIAGTCGGPMIGLFSLGIFFRKANTKGAIVGSVTSMIVTAGLGIGSYISPPTYHKKPVFVDGCVGLNVTLGAPIIEQVKQDSGFNIFHLSYLYYSALAVFIVIAVGLAVSCLTASKDEKEVRDDLLSPLYHTISGWTRNKNQNQKQEQYPADRNLTPEAAVAFLEKNASELTNEKKEDEAANVQVVKVYNSSV